MRVIKRELPKELTEKTACEFIGRIAAVCTGKPPKTDADAERIGRFNLTEDHGKPTRAWEFLPYDIHYKMEYYNFRCAMSSGKSLGTIVSDMVNNYNGGTSVLKEYSSFNIFSITVPRFVAAHIKTHNTISSLMSSIRIGCSGEKEYWFPEIEENKDKPLWNGICQDRHLTLNKGDYFHTDFTGSEFTETLQFYYKRSEITKRPLSDFELVDMELGAYKYDWLRFTKTRSKKSCACSPDCKKRCVQDETAWIAQEIKKLLND